MSEENTAENLDDVEEEGVVDESTDGSDPVEQSANEEGDSEANSSSVNEPSNAEARPVESPDQANNAASDGPHADLSMILDIPVTLSMEIGQTRISISELLKLSKDSVIELQRMADEPMDVLVNGTLVARGEAVVVGDRFGIRLTDVISSQERLRKFT